MKLKIAEDLSLPVDVVTQTVAVLAKRRAGKSYTMRRLVEQLHQAGQQVVLVDPKGDQWGIRSAADGKAPGLPIVILGGERADVPLESGSGETVAKLVVEERVSALLDLSLFRKHEVATFMTGFLETLYRLKAREVYRTPMMLVIDEADAIAPQKPQKGEERMLGAAEDIVRRGGQRGIGCVLVTQRSAVLNKNVLTQAQVLIALRTIAPQDLTAMNAWIDVHGTPEQRKTLMESLPSLPIGDAWVWSPGWPTVDGIFKRVHVLPIDTFDSGASPDPGTKKRAEPKTIAEVDLEALKRQMSATIEKAKADDPRELRKQIAELKKQAAAASVAKVANVITPKKTRTVEKPVLKDGQLARAEKLVQSIDAALTRYADRIEKSFGDFQTKHYAELTRLRGAAEVISTAIASTRAPQRDNPTTTAQRQHPLASSPRRVEPERKVAPAAPRVSSTNGGSGVDLPIGEKKILSVVAQYPAGATREQLTIIAGYKRSSRDAYVSRLAAKGYVSIDNGAVRPTAGGITALGDDHEPLPTGAELRSWWLQRVPSGERVLLEAAIQAYPNDVDKETITAYKRSSRDAYISRLAARRIITTGRGTFRASEELFS